MTVFPALASDAVIVVGLTENRLELLDCRFKEPFKPELFTVNVRLLVYPLVTVPNFSDVGVGVIVVAHFPTKVTLAVAPLLVSMMLIVPP